MGQRKRVLYVRIYHASTTMSGVLMVSAHGDVSSVMRNPDEVVKVGNDAALEALVASYPDYLVTHLGQIESASSVDAGAIFKRLTGS